MEILNIQSTQNELVKYCVKLQNPKFRNQEKMIFTDGEKTILGLINDGFEFEYLFLKENHNLDISAVKAKKIVISSSSVLKKISTTSSPVEYAGIIKEPEVGKNIFKKLNRIILLENIKDAGNLGTIIRSANAFSMDGIILFGDCVDLYNSKVIRASAQNMFKIPIITTSDIDFILELKKTHKFISTVVDSKNDFLNYKFKNKYILAFGSEANGLSDCILNISDQKLTLTMKKNVESLNLATSASVAFALIDFNCCAR